MTDQWALPEIVYALCNRCGTCVEMCPTQAVDMTPQGPVIARPADCTYCAECESLCPQGAITCTFEIAWAEGEVG